MATDSKHFLSGRKIIVSGAGPGGLTFVLSLLKFWDAAIPLPEIVIVDADGRDESINRWPYEIQLSSETEVSPLVALRDLGLYDAAKAQAKYFVNPEAVINVWDKSWKPIMAVKPKIFEGFSTSGLRLSRTALLTILIEAVEAKTKITWGTSVQDAKRLPDGRFSVSLLDKASGASSQEECDLLVAADGDESTLRKIFRPNDVSEPTGHLCMGGAAEFGSISSIPSQISINNGIVVSGDGVAGAIVHVRDNGRMMWAVYKEEKTPRAAYDKTDAAAFEGLLEEARTLTKSIAEPLQTVIGKTIQDTSFCRAVRERDPFTHEAPELRGVFFIGEANRFVTGYMGSGGEMAIRDGFSLAQELVRQTSLDQARIGYDKESLPRTTKVLKQGRTTRTTAHLTGWKWSVAKTALAAGNYLTG
ncbi:hypothetical protein PWT90_04981 [Aphanocladium album]|nr:hypothetical protein PWT90_04981 [Aphanocladium album]